MVRLNVDARPEGRLVAVRVGRGYGAPPHRIDKPRQLGRVIKGFQVDAIGKALSWSDRVADLELPHNAQRLIEATLVEGLEVDDVRELRRGLVRRATRETLGSDVCHRPGRATDLHNLSRLGQWRRASSVSARTFGGSIADTCHFMSRRSRAAGLSA